MQLVAYLDVGYERIVPVRVCRQCLDEKRPDHVAIIVAKLPAKTVLGVIVQHSEILNFAHALQVEHDVRKALRCLLQRCADN